MDTLEKFIAMKKLLLLISLSIILSCCNNDDDKPKTELEKLPLATQTGANTFGCLLDGKAFLPGSGSNPLDCVYQYVDGGYYLALQANKRDELNNRISIALGSINFQIQQGFTYNLLANSEGNVTGIYSYAGNNTYTSSTHFGELYITKLDEINHIVSGTFWYNIIDFQGNLHQIRDGRFDMQYTN
jgi:hypothetical protein